MILAVVMVLQRVEGCSDREAVDRFSYDARWKYAAGGLGFAYPGFAHTVLVDMRARLAASERPDRIFEVVLEMGRRGGLVGRRRVLDSTALYDAVATMDTVTLIRSAIRAQSDPVCVLAGSAHHGDDLFHRRRVPRVEQLLIRRWAAERGGECRALRGGVRRPLGSRSAPTRGG